MWRLEGRKATCKFNSRSKELCAATDILKLSSLLPSLALEAWNSFWVSLLWALGVSHLSWSYQRMPAWSPGGEKFSPRSSSSGLLLKTQGLCHQGIGHGSSILVPQSHTVPARDWGSDAVKKVAKKPSCSHPGKRAIYLIRYLISQWPSDTTTVEILFFPTAL